MKVSVDNLSISDISTGQVRIPISGEISLLIGSGTGNYPSSRIQKGPVLVYKNEDLSEEGVGFGVPVLKLGHEAIFPGSRCITAKRNGGTIVINVDYDLNLVERMAIKGNKKIDSRAFYKIKEWFHGLHRAYPRFRGILMPAFNTVSRTCGIETRFDKVVSAGLVGVTYTIHPWESTVLISVDTSRVKKDECSEVVLLNELGANYFSRYHDSTGVTLEGDKIGTWDETFAEDVSFIDFKHEIKFTLKKIKGSRMLRGRELAANRLAWSGIAYVIHPHTVNFDYDIRIGANI